MQYQSGFFALESIEQVCLGYEDDVILQNPFCNPKASENIFHRCIEIYNDDFRYDGGGGGGKWSQYYSNILRLLLQMKHQLFTFLFSFFFYKNREKIKISRLKIKRS